MCDIQEYEREIHMLAMTIAVIFSQAYLML